MKFVTSLSVERPHSESHQFWPHGLQRLVVVVSRSDHRHDMLVAYGIDPGVHHGHVVFHAEFSPHRLSAFIKAVIDGDTVACADQAFAVRPHHDPADPGPKVALALAAAIRSQETLAEAVASRPPPHVRGKDGC